METNQIMTKCLVIGIFYLCMGASLITGISQTASADSLILSNENPADGSSYVSVYLPEISFTVTDSENRSIQYTVTTTPDFIGGPHNGTVASGTTVHILRRNGMLTNDTQYTWSVNATDGTVSANCTFTFFTISNAFQGYTLFSPLEITNDLTFLIDNDGQVVHTWPTPDPPSYCVYMVDHGSIIRPCVIYEGASPEYIRKIQKISWNGTLLWDYQYSGDGYWQTHDIASLPNGDVLILALEKKTPAEAIAAGRNPALLWENELWPAYLVEVKPTGLKTGDIVWEWHFWDHLVQDFDPTKANYGIVSDHPELLDINFAIDGNKDWIHPNTICYNPALDQIIINSRHLGEFWIIDHSTTTVEAAGHTGGVHGKGGDFLYRWGNPLSYRAGNADDQKLFGAHDAQWITPGCPGEGDILIFNNGWRRPGTPYSSIDEITPPIDSHGNYTLVPGTAYGPENLTWRYSAVEPYTFYADFISGCQRLPNGDTLICNGPIGFLFEVTMEGKTVWSYQNNFFPPQCKVFRVRRYFAPFSPPIIPTITGPANGTVGMSYNFTFETVDPNGNDVYYNVNWGDNTSVNWVGPFPSGEKLTLNHIWGAEGHYVIMCEAKDGYNSISNRSTMIVNIGTPFQPNSPFPADGATDVDIHVNLSWSGGDPDPGDFVTYDVFFGDTNPPPMISHKQNATFFNAGMLGYSETIFWKIIAWDNHGVSTNGQLWNFTTTLDTTAPITHVSVNGTIGSNHWFVSPVLISFTASDTQSGVNSTFYKIDSDPWTVYASPVAVSNDGVHELMYYSVDKVGNIEEPKTALLAIDTKTPQTTHTLTGTMGDNEWYTSNVTITLSATDKTSGIYHIYYQLDSENWSFYTAPVVVASDGSHTLRYYAVDVAGNVEQVNGPFVFKIDSTTPITTHLFMGPQGNNQWYTSNVTVTLFTSDPDPLQKLVILPIIGTCHSPSGINHTYDKIDNNPWSEYSGSFSVSTDGVHSFSYYSVDYAGNAENIQGPFPLKIDKTAPIITLTVTAQNLLQTAWLLTADVNDTTSGVDKVEFYIDNSLQETVFAPGPYEYVYEGTGKVACANVFDVAGNSKTSLCVNCQDLPLQSKNTLSNLLQYPALVKHANRL